MSGAPSADEAAGAGPAPAPANSAALSAMFARSRRNRAAREAAESAENVAAAPASPHTPRWIVDPYLGEIWRDKILSTRTYPGVLDALNKRTQEKKIRLPDIWTPANPPANTYFMIEPSTNHYIVKAYSTIHPNPEISHLTIPRKSQEVHITDPITKKSINLGGRRRTRRATGRMYRKRVGRPSTRRVR